MRPQAALRVQAVAAAARADLLQAHAPRLQAGPQDVVHHERLSGGRARPRQDAAAVLQHDGRPRLLRAEEDERLRAAQEHKGLLLQWHRQREYLLQ